MTLLPIILVVDDEMRSQESLRRVLEEDFEVLTASSADEAAHVLESEMVHAILCDQRMPGMAGVDFLKQARERWPDPVRMIISGYSESEDIIAGVNEAGIYHYITKPWEPEDLVRTVKGAVELYTLQRENQIASVEMKTSPAQLERELHKKRDTLRVLNHFDRIVHAPGSPLRQSLDLARKIAGYDISVLITGESGTGKELLARAVHTASLRADKPFVVENCGALPDQLLESELFGCKKGAFTGAYEDRIGLFEQANGGTVFLDEIGETSPAFQVKLLRVLQEGEIRPLGSRLTRKVDVRVIAATNRNLEEEIKAKRFRRDLYYRLAAFPIHLAPLRERPMDIPLLIDLLLGEARKIFGKPLTGLDPTALAILLGHDWPGNVRELRNEIQRMAALAERDWLSPDLLSSHLLQSPTRTNTASQSGERSLKDQVEALEERLIREALHRHQGNISRTADQLGLSRVGLRAKLQRYGLEREKLETEDLMREDHRGQGV